jgi:nucleotide-binding universal stress UspA family protein
MTPFHRILVAVDFSSHSARALEIATDLAHRFDSAVTILHVYEPNIYAGPGSYMVPTSTYDRARPAVLATLEQQLERNSEDLHTAGVRDVETALLQGTPYDQIVEYARDNDHDLIVLGTHGRTGIRRALLGSVAERVVRKAPCAVLTVRLPEAAREELASAESMP